MKGFDVIKYQLFGLDLQEPVSLIYNWLVAVLCMVWYFKLKPVNNAVSNWRIFFLIFSITCFFAGLAHSFYQYTGIYGKIPHWIGGIVSGYFAGKAMLTLLKDSKTKKWLTILLPIKSVLNMVLALSFLNFIFVTIDSILAYIVYCAGIAIILMKKGQKDVRLYLYGVLVCLPAVFCFLLKIDLSIYFNREDLSHVFMLSCLICFYYATKKLEQRGADSLV